MTIYLLKYNNYYNRTIKRYSTINELLDRNDVAVIGTFENVNFNPGDGVATQLTLNYTSLYQQPNYLVVEDTSQPNVITLSSWFILDAQYVRLGQYVLTLRRDLVNDLWDIVSDSPMFVEKATLSASSPLLFNRENMTYNQIKTNEFLLHDETKIPWIVGYINKEFSAEGDDKITIPSPAVEADVRQELASWDEYRYNDIITNKKLVGVQDSSILYIMEYFYNTTTGVHSQQIRWDKNEQPPAATSGSEAEGSYLFNQEPDRQVGYLGSVITHRYYLEPLLQGFARTSFNDISYDSYLTDSSLRTQSITEEIYNSENGAIYKVGNKLYRIEITPDNQYSTTNNVVSVPQNSELGLRFKTVGDVMLAAPNVFQRLYSNPYMMAYDTYGYSVTTHEVAGGTIDIEIPLDRPHTTDAPYDIFCIPYGNIGWNGDFVRTNREYAWKAAQAIIRKAVVGENLYDIQLLSYCPIRDRLKASVVEGVTNVIPREGDIAVTYKAPGALVATVYAGIAWVDKGDFSFSLDTNLYEGLPELTTLQSSAIERKVANETDIYRLTSPNYNGTFEFSVQKNGGVTSFDIDCSYKPYQPYIRISPAFGGLYGRDFNDARGLVLGGDFSLPQMTEAWQSYQNQNKNYQVMFDRQIQNIDVNNAIQRTMEKWQIATGIATGATTGGIAGSMIPGAGAIGAGIGTYLGGIASGIGGALDYKFNEQLRQEARDYTIDQFGYQLGNIQARPDSLTKVSSFNPNNKYFPVLEYYTATNTEKEALRKKLQYNGMTVMVIGTIAEYLQTEPSYIKGRLIRLNDDMEDYHIVNALADELYQGVYV